jgi:hypothetical protein
MNVTLTSVVVVLAGFATYMLGDGSRWRGSAEP